MMSPRSVQRSRLVRLVQQWSASPGGPATPPGVARWAQGLGAFEAVRLSGALGQIEAYAPIAPLPAATASVSSPLADGWPTAPWAALAAQVQALPAELQAAMAERPAPQDADWPLHAHRIADLQHRMAAQVARLRGQVRQCMGQASARWRQLAALDQSLEQALSAKEHAALSTLVAHLGQRFSQRLGGSVPPFATPADNAPTTAAEGGAAPPAAHTQAALNGFERDVRLALEADLQLRLQPVVGLLAAVAGQAHGSAA